jgi:hypothetical protein
VASLDERMGRALERIATATNGHRARAADELRAPRNGSGDPETTVVRLEFVARELWRALDPATDADADLRRVA